MKFSVFTVIIIRTFLLYTVSCCDPPTKERELKRVRSCMSYWSFYRDNNNPTLQELFHERMKNEICQEENGKHVYLCITHIAGRCPHLLIYWRHIYDPISHICDFQRDFNDSKKCRSHPTFTLMFQACQEEYQKLRSDDKIDCWQYKWHKDCLMAFVEKIDDCNFGSTKPLIDRVLFYHYRHLAAYNRCKYEHEKPIPDVGSIVAAKNNTINGQ